MGFGEVDILLAEGGEGAGEIGVLDCIVQGEFLVDPTLMGTWAFWDVSSQGAAEVGFVLRRRGGRA